MVSPAARAMSARRYTRLGSKDLNQAAIAKSAVVPQQIVAPQQGWDALGENLLMAAANTATSIRPWGTAAALRDRQLRSFLTQEPFAHSAIATVIARNVGLSWTLDGPPRVVSRTQDMLQQAEFGQGWEALAVKLGWDYQDQDKGAVAELVRDFDDMRAPVVGINHLDAGRCLGRDSRVLMADGSPKAILDIVRDRDPGPVMALGPDGQLHPRAITGWYESALAGRYWLRLRLKGARHIYGRREGLWLTNDHEVLTSDGWQRAEHLGLGSKIVTQFPTPNPEQLELLVGTLLGDASLGGKTADRRFISLGHAAKQEDWLVTKREALAGFRWSATRGARFRQTQSEISPGLSDLAAAFYPEGKKIVPRELVEATFGPRLLAAWYADDGYMQKARWGRPKSRFYCQGFDREDIDWLADLLTRRGFPAVVRPKRYHTGPYAGRTYWHLYLGVEATETMFAAVASYLPACLRYKLPDDAAAFEPERWQIGTAERWAAPVEAIERGNNGDQTATFCIDVEEDHNFVAGGMVVHNCWHTGNVQYPILYQDRVGRWHAMAWYQVLKLSEMPAPHETLYGLQYCSLTRMLAVAQTVMNILKIHEEKSGGRFTSSVKLVSGIRRGEIEGAMTQAQSFADEQGLMRYIRPTILTTTDPMAEPKMIDLDLATLPADFDFDKNFQWYLTLYSMALLSDYSEFAPLPGKGGIGTATQVETQHRKSRAKGVAIWTNRVEHAFNFFGVVPRNVTFSYDDKDLEEDQARADVMLAYSQAFQYLMTGGAIDAQAVRELLRDAGLIPQDIFDAMLLRLKQTIGDETAGSSDASLSAIDRQATLDDTTSSAAAAVPNTATTTAPDNQDSELGQRQMTQALDAERVLVEDRLTEEARRALSSMGSAMTRRLGGKEVGDRSFNPRVWQGAETTGRKAVSQTLPEVQVTPAQIHVLMPPTPPPPAPRLVRTTKHIKRDPDTGKIADVVEEQQEL